MSSIDGIVNVTISRQTQNITRAGFGIIMVLAEFATSKTTTAFERYREYANLTAMSSDGWASGDAPYDAAAKVFAQNPNVSKIMVGRKDSTDADWGTALAAIKLANDTWYGAVLVGENDSIMTFDSDFVASNSIAVTVNGTAVTPVVYATSSAATLTALGAQIEADITNSTATVDTGDKSITVNIPGIDVVATVVVTLGASQPTAIIEIDAIDSQKEVAAWIETEKKIFLISEDTADGQSSSSTTDILYFIKSQNYDRTGAWWHGYSTEYIEAAAMGEAFPYDPGSQTWAFKTYSGVTADLLSSGDETNVLAKNANVYVEKGGVSNTINGTMGSGEYIDVIRGIDWVEARLQEAVFTNFINQRKVDMDDGGIQGTKNIVEGVLKEASRKKILQLSSIVVTAPLYSELTEAEKLSRTVPITFSAVLLGAIHVVNITGTITV